MPDYLTTGDAAQVLDLQLLPWALRGYGVADGLVPSRSAQLTTEVTAGTAFVNETPVTHDAAASVTHDGGDTDPRRDVVYVGSDAGTATLAIARGTPGAAVHARGNEGVNFSDAPFEFAAPAPPTMDDIPGTPIAEVAIPAGATDYDEALHLRSLRQTTDLVVERLTANGTLDLPAYDNVADAPATANTLIRITGNGADDPGVYVHDGAGYSRMGEGLSITDLAIDADRDWGGQSITNLGFLEINEGFRVEQGRGSFSLPDQHTRYASGLDNAEVARWSLDADEVLEVTRLEVVHLGGGTNVDFTVELRDESDGSTLASTSDSVRGSPAGTSAAGADITLRVTNLTGAAVDATVSGQLFRRLV